MGAKNGEYEHDYSAMAKNEHKVPLLIHGNNPVSESVVILEYIEETWLENPLMPQDPYDRATTRFWSKFIDDKVKSTLG
ncbi:hypothetical protein AMTR_s00130p00089050 [Amborella trichopoda]|uniref:Glutathione S-transferase n=1 Tax=Amborella trichopoda TaxID=13333 RepID=W1NQG2_AMBTC|nr:hypothetical protein AMTR_s00130p00089050 [Amborella trichopoda]